MNTLAPGATGRRFLGVDVGISGAIAVIDEAGTLIVVYDMPCLAEGAKNRRTIDAVLLHSILRDEPAIEHAYVEGCLGSCRIPTTFLTPPSWKRAVGLSCGTNKDASRSMAIARWPQHAEW
ncbi:MAG: hypothetical protein WA231_11980, partial [Methylocella sp.]